MEKELDEAENVKGKFLYHMALFLLLVLPTNIHDKKKKKKGVFLSF
jgi:hypothetical protein